MKLIMKILTNVDDMNGHKHSAELYRRLSKRTPALTGEGGLGKVFIDALLPIVKQAFDINEARKTVAVRNVERLNQLAKGYSHEVKIDDIKKNIKKAGICLALICITNDKNHIAIRDEAIVKLRFYYHKDGLDAESDRQEVIAELDKIKLTYYPDAEEIALPLAERMTRPVSHPMEPSEQSESPSASVTPYSSQASEKSPASDVKEEYSIHIIGPEIAGDSESDPDLSRRDSTNSTGSMSANSDEKSPLTIIVPSVEVPEVVELEDEKPEEVINKFLNDMDKLLDDNANSLENVKKEQRQYYFHRLEKLKLAELDYLMVYLQDIQNKKIIDKRFDNIRKERCNIGEAGNTNTWLNIAIQTKRQFLAKLHTQFAGVPMPATGKYLLSPDRFAHIQNMMGQHSARFFSPKEKKLAMDFREDFMPRAAKR